jgi:hypothetical protein
MSYEGRHRAAQSNGSGGGFGVARVAGLAGAAATAAAILSVGFGAGTAQAWPGLGHKNPDPKPSSSDTSSTTSKTNLTTGSSVTSAATAAKTPFGNFIIKQPTGDGSYFSFNGTGKAISGICLNPKGC